MKNKKYYGIIISLCLIIFVGLYVLSSIYIEELIFEYISMMRFTSEILDLAIVFRGLCALIIIVITFFSYNLLEVKSNSYRLHIAINTVLFLLVVWGIYLTTEVLSSGISDYNLPGQGFYNAYAMYSSINYVLVPLILLASLTTFCIGLFKKK